MLVPFKMRVRKAALPEGYRRGLAWFVLYSYRFLHSFNWNPSECAKLECALLNSCLNGPKCDIVEVVVKSVSILRSAFGIVSELGNMSFVLRCAVFLYM